MHWRQSRDLTHGIYAGCAIMVFMVLVTGLMAYVCYRLHL